MAWLRCQKHQQVMHAEDSLRNFHVSISNFYAAVYVKNLASKVCVAFSLLAHQDTKNIINTSNFTKNYLKKEK